MGEIYLDANSTATTITTTQTYTKVAPGAWAAGTSKNFDMPSDGRLRYIGKSKIHVHLGCTMSMQSASGANKVFRAVLYKNGTVNVNNEYTGGTQLNAGIIENTLATASVSQSTAIHVMTTMVENDYIELGIANWTDAVDATITFANLFLVAMVTK